MAGYILFGIKQSLFVVYGHSAQSQRRTDSSEGSEEGEVHMH